MKPKFMSFKDMKFLAHNPRALIGFTRSRKSQKVRKNITFKHGLISDSDLRKIFK